MKILFAAAFTLLSIGVHAAERPFELQVVDSETGRGIPLVEVETVNRISYVTDSHGRVAFDEPGLLGRSVYFQIRSHGYETPQDGFGFRGVRLTTSAGGRAEVKLKRLNIAERLYRLTGQGIYADSVRLGYQPPLQEPLLNGLVVGQDSAMATVYRGNIHWFWGDTSWAAYPLGQFQTSGATSKLPTDGGLTPDVGVDFTYFTRDDGFSRPMAPLPEPGVVWIDGLLTVRGDDGGEVMIAHYSRRKDLATELEHGLMQYDDHKNRFQRIKTLDASNTWRHPRGQATFHEGFWYFVHPFAVTRVPATLAAVVDPRAYEALAATTTDSGAHGYTWQKVEAPVDQKSEAARLEQDRSNAPVPLLQLHDAETGKEVRAHASSIRWNAHRKRWVLITTQIEGTSFLGEVWYAEAPAITGPWKGAVKIVTHDKYSFYNPVQHAFFDQEDGRVIYFEGTYTHTFSGNHQATPRYDYNQIMYRLDVDHPRLAPARHSAE